MTFTIQDITADGWARRSPLSKAGRTIGPVTAAKQRRIAIVYIALCTLGLAPALLNLSATWQAAGLGLLFPGAGFLAVGGWALLLIPVALALFALALFAWFGSGMVIAPVIVWLGSAALAGAMAAAAPTPYSAFVAPGLVITFGAWASWRSSKSRRAAVGVRKARESAMPAAVAAALSAATPRPAAGARELSVEELAAARYLLDRALQPVDGFEGFDIVDQFQTAALRYQINHIGFGLAELQCNVTPSFHGYLSQAQRNMIEKYLDRRVWTYWLYETAWGHLNLTNFDPAARDNIMLTGWLGLHAGMYMLASGDRRYAEPGSLTFRLNDRVAYEHDIRSLNRSVEDNFEAGAFCLYPCEPNWVYPICNHYGLASLAVSDRLFGTDKVAQVQERWLESLDTEFTDESGSIIGLRSSLTGLRFPFPGGELGFANFMNTFAPERAWRMWAVGRSALAPAVLKDEEGPYLAMGAPAFDFGNYRRGRGGAAASILAIANEFGDDALAEACRGSLDRFGGRAEDGGVLRFEHMSNLSNVSAAFGRFRRRGDFRTAVTEGPPASVFTGPLLSEAAYPEVLVAKAFSTGEDLDLVLYNGAAPGPQTIGLERLRPGRAYRTIGDVTAEFRADGEGRASLAPRLDGRTRFRIIPAD
ncbi:MAG TPA: hypothetical protein VF459_11080 [Caulobacteraceae bacterium]